MKEKFNMKVIESLMDETISKLKHQKEILSHSQILSPYNLSHNEIGDCCGVFDRIDENGMIYCNECGKRMRDEIDYLLSDKRHK